MESGTWLIMGIRVNNPFVSGKMKKVAPGIPFMKNGDFLTERIR